MIDDGRTLRLWCPHRPTLPPILGVDEGVLVRPLDDGQALETHLDPGLVHHGEHRPHPLIGLPDHPAGGVLERHHAGRAGMDPEFVLDRNALDGVAITDGSVGVHQELGHEEQGDPTGAGRCIRNPGQNEMDDVVGEVVLAPRDEDLGAVDAPRSVGVRFRPAAQGADIGAGLRLGQHHRAGPLGRDQFLQIQGPELFGAVMLEQRDGAPGQHRAE